MGRRRRRVGSFGLLGRVLSGRYLHVLACLICLLMVVICILLPADEMAARYLGFRWHLYCFLNDLFGLNNASGGLVRSFAALCDGQIERAFGYHFLGPILFAFILMEIPYQAWAAWRWPRSVGVKARLAHLGLAGIVIAVIVIDRVLLLGGQVP